MTQMMSLSLPHLIPSFSSLIVSSRSPRGEVFFADWTFPSAQRRHQQGTAKGAALRGDHDVPTASHHVVGVLLVVMVMQLEMGVWYNVCGLGGNLFSIFGPDMLADHQVIMPPSYSEGRSHQRGGKGTV